MKRPDYGQDSPGVVRGLAIAGSYAVAATFAGAARVWLSNPGFLWALPGWMMTATKPLG